jgi:hypothetical protein
MRPACQPPPIRDRKIESRHTRYGESFFSRLLERDDFPLNRHPALTYCWSMIFSENRYPLFGIML